MLNHARGMPPAYLLGLSKVPSPGLKTAFFLPIAACPLSMTTTQQKQETSIFANFSHQ
jgi:hypothetical protein